MRLFPSIALSALVGLGACDGAPVIESGAPATETPAPQTFTLGDTDLTGDLRLLGTEPFWAVTFSGAAVTFSGVDRPEQRATRSAPTMQGAVAAWSLTTDAGDTLAITLTGAPCSDNMSDRTYPMSARVEISGETLIGCAASAEWLASVDEQGNPRQSDAEAG